MILVVLLFFIFWVVAPAVAGVIFMFLWNNIATPLFGAPEISLWVAIGLWLLIRIVGGCLRGN